MGDATIFQSFIFEAFEVSTRYHFILNLNKQKKNIYAYGLSWDDSINYFHLPESH